MARSIAIALESELLSARSRRTLGVVDGLQGASYDTASRVHSLKSSLDRFSDDPVNSELLRHYPVAAIAVLESHFKASVAEIVNFGPTYLERGISIAKDRFRAPIELIQLLHGKSVSVGELVAHALPFNSVSSLDVLGQLLDTPLKSLLSKAVDPYLARNGASEAPDSLPLIDDVSELWRELAATFEQRHVLAHECAPNFVVSREDAMRSIRCVEKFTVGWNAVMWATIWLNQPLTQYEMNVDAWNQYRSSRQVLARRLRRGMELASEDRLRHKFRELHLQWKRYSESWIAMETAPLAMGSIRPMLEAHSRTQAIRARADAVKSWIERVRFEDAGSSED